MAAAVEVRGPREIPPVAAQIDVQAPAPLSLRVVKRGFVTCSLLVVACSAPSRDPQTCVADTGPRLAVTTTDSATGAVTIIDVDDRCVQPDVGLASTDAVPVVSGRELYVLNRHTFDYVDVLDVDDQWSLSGEMAISAEGVTSTNPHDLVVDADGLAYVGLYGAPEVQVLDVIEKELVGRIGVEDFADADGIPEANLMTIYDGRLFVIVEHLDRTSLWARVGDDEAIVIDLESRQVVDVDPDTDGVQAIQLLGNWSKQLRGVPKRPSARYVLSTGIYELDLDALTAEWVIDEAAMAAVGITDEDQTLAFDVTDDGQTFVVAAYDEGWTEATLYSVPADGSGGLTEVVGDLNAVERSLEVVGDEIWFGDTTPDQGGMQAFDFEGNSLLEDPLTTGLPPYAVAFVP